MFFFWGGGGGERICGSWDGDNIGNWVKNNFWPKIDHAGPCRFAINSVCVYEPKQIITSLDIKKSLPTLISTDVATPPCHPPATTCNISG